MPNIDLTALSAWSSLSSGSHSITIVAKAENYRDSEPSAAVQVGLGGINGASNLRSDIGGRIVYRPV